MWPLAAVLAMVTGLVVLGPSAPAPAADGTRVLMVDNEPDLTRWHFDPAELTVPAGTTVVWQNKGKEEHTVTAEDKSFDSGMKRSGATFQRAFPKAGRYAYYCAPHPWMKGAVQVVAGATAAGRTAAEAPATQATAAPVATTATTSAPTSTTFPPTLAAPTASTPAPSETTTSAPAQAADPDPDTAEDAAAARRDTDSGAGLAGTLAVVLIPTLAGLALGAKLRQSKSHDAEPA